MKLVVVGAGGGTGRLVVSEGLRAGHAVTAFVRHETRFEDGVRVVTGDASDEDATAQALEGQDAVIDTVGGTHPTS